MSDRDLTTDEVAAAMAAAELANISERRVEQLVNPHLSSGLPPFLAPSSGLNSGFMMAQVSAASLASECKVLSHPASVDTIPTDGSKEDVVPMAMGAAWKARRVLRNLENILAIELMCAAQGLDFRAPLRPGIGVARHADAGYPAAIATAEREGLRIPMREEREC